MIKIQDKIWAVVHSQRGPLAYMCQVSLKSDGTPDNATAKMQDTGRTWARSGPIREQETGTEAFYDNIPTTGHTLGDSVSRWTTENKLFEVIDPRGFMVQVPTGNISTLLKHCTVIKGVVQEECVWGREGGSHILLPVNSEPYIEAKTMIKRVATEVVTAPNLKLGDRFRQVRYGDVSKTEYEFFGMIKVSWLRQCSKNQYRHSGWARGACTDLVKSLPLPDETVKDDKWVAVLGWQSDQYDHKLKAGSPEWEASHYKKWHFDLELNPKALNVVAGEPSMPLTVELLRDCYTYCPERVTKRFTDTNMNRTSSYEEWRVVGKDTICAIEFKPEKKR